MKACCHDPSRVHLDFLLAFYAYAIKNLISQISISIPAEAQAGARAGGEAGAEAALTTPSSSEVAEITLCWVFHIRLRPSFRGQEFLFNVARSAMYKPFPKSSTLYYYSRTSIHTS